MDDALERLAGDADLAHRAEEAGLNASAPTEQLLVDGWLVRTCPVKAKRARCVNAISPGRWPIERKLETIERLYAQAGLPALIRITPFSVPTGLDERLADCSWRRIDDTRVMMADTLPAAAAPSPAGLTWDAVGHEAFAHAVGALRGSPLAQREAHARRLAASPVPFHGGLVRRDGETLACGQVALERDLVGLYDVFTAPAERGRGLAGWLCRQLLVWSRAHGARVGYLQVEGDNHPARAIYRGMGFRDVYRYHYRTPHPDAE